MGGVPVPAGAPAAAASAGTDADPPATTGAAFEPGTPCALAFCAWDKIGQGGGAAAGGAAGGIGVLASTTDRFLGPHETVR